MGFTLEFRVCSISPELFERFSLNFTQMFLLVIRCAEPMTQLCKLKSQGHTSRSWAVTGDMAVLQTAVLFPLSWSDTLRIQVIERSFLLFCFLLKVFQRESLLSLTLEYNMLGFLQSCITQWATGGMQIVFFYVWRGYYTLYRAA